MKARDFLWLIRLSLEAAFSIVFFVLALLASPFWNGAISGLAVGVFVYELTSFFYLRRIKDEQLRRQRHCLIQGIFVSLHPVLYIVMLLGFLAANTLTQPLYATCFGLAYLILEAFFLVYPFLVDKGKTAWGDAIICFHNLMIIGLFVLTPVMQGGGNLLFFLICWIVMMILNIILSSLLFLWGGIIGLIRSIVSYCAKKELGAPLAASFSTMMAITSIVSWAKTQQIMFLPLASFYLAFALIRFGCFFWKRVIDNRYRDNEEERIGHSHKIAFFGSILLAAFDVNYPIVLLVLVYQAVNNSVFSWFFFVQMGHAVFRILLAIRGFKRERNKIPYYRFSFTLDIIVMMYASTATAALGLNYLNRSWTKWVLLAMILSAIGVTVYMLVRVFVMSLKNMILYNASKEDEPHEPDL